MPTYNRYLHLKIVAYNPDLVSMEVKRKVPNCFLKDACIVSFQIPLLKISFLLWLMLAGAYQLCSMTAFKVSKSAFALHWNKPFIAFGQNIFEWQYLFLDWKDEVCIWIFLTPSLDVTKELYISQTFPLKTSSKSIQRYIPQNTFNSMDQHTSTEIYLIENVPSSSSKKTMQ